MRSRVGVVVLAFAAGCYQSPNACDRITCSTQGGCPDGLTCTNNVCVGPGMPTCPMKSIDFVDVGVGAAHVCGLDVAGAVYCWGSNAYGQTGTGPDPSPVAAPAQIGTGFTALAVGADHACGLKNGMPTCWGYDQDGEVEGGSTFSFPTPVAVAFGAGAPATFAQISAGGAHSCAIGGDGSLWCWGDHNALGVSSTNSTAIRIGTDADWSAVSVGNDHVCGLRAGNVYCVGHNDTGQIKLPANATIITTPTAVAIPAGLTAIAVASGDGTTCAILAATTPATSGQLYCWGLNSANRGLMAPTTNMDAHLAPTQIGTDADWTAISLTFTFACGVRGGDAFCWGQQSNGGFGDGFWNGTRLYTDPMIKPIAAVDAIVTYKTGTAGHEFLETACSRIGHAVSCWGNNKYGQLGQGTVSFHASPVQITPPKNHTGWKLVRGGRNHACATTEDDAVFCWGQDDAGAVSASVARGTTQPCLTGQPCDFATPTPAPAPVAKASMLIAGSDVFSDDYTCALDGATLRCWGADSDGQLGPNVNGEGPVAVAQPVGQTWNRIVGGDHATCGFTTESPADAWCWGRIVGVNVQTPAKLPTATTQNLGDVHFGDNHACGVQTATQTRVCWGHNDTYQLGDGTMNQFNSPSAFDATTVAIAAHGASTCKIDPNANVLCFGNNIQHQAGGPDAGAPVMTPGLIVDVTSTPIGGCTRVELAGDHGCALCSGKVMCWGDSGTGRGDSMAGQHFAVPIDAPGVMFSDLATVSGAGCAIDAGRQLWCWGDSMHGVVGDGSQDRNLPTPIAP